MFDNKVDKGLDMDNKEQASIKEKNAFALLGFDNIDFSISTEEIEKAYKSKMLEFHPDRFSQEQMKLKALQICADINDAYNILKDPYKRGVHIIEIIGESDKLSNTIDNKNVLQESFMLQEMINDETDKQKLSQLQESNNQKVQNLLSEIAKDLEAKDISKAIEHINALRYTQKIAQQIGDKLR